MGAIRAIGLVLMLFGVIMLGTNDYYGVLFVIGGLPLVFYDLVSYYIKLKIFYKLNNENEDSKYKVDAPKVRKPRRPKI